MEALVEAQRLLSDVTLDEYLLTLPPCTVITLSPVTTLAAALQRLAQASILSAPVVTHEGIYAGFVDVMDIVSGVFEEERSPAALAAFLQHATISSIRRSNDGQLVRKTEGGTTLLEVVCRGFVLPEFKLWSHRIAVFEDPNDTLLNNDRQHQRSVKIIAIMSQSDVVRYLHRHRRQLPGLMATPLHALGLGRKPVFYIDHSTCALDAYREMVASGYSAAAVVQDGHLVANLSAADLRGLDVQDLGTLGLPVAEFLVNRKFSAVVTHVPGSLAEMYGVRSPCMLPKAASEALAGEIVACKEDAAFGDVLDLVVSHKVHRVWIINGVGAPIGVVSLSDLLEAVAI